MTIAAGIENCSWTDTKGNIAWLREPYVASQLSKSMVEQSSRCYTDCLVSRYIASLRALLACMVWLSTRLNDPARNDNYGRNRRLRLVEGQGQYRMST
jgi:hypothetical protein